MLFRRTIKKEHIVLPVNPIVLDSYFPIYLFFFRNMQVGCSIYQFIFVVLPDLINCHLCRLLLVCLGFLFIFASFVRLLFIISLTLNLLGLLFFLLSRPSAIFFWLLSRMNALFILCFSKIFWTFLLLILSVLDCRTSLLSIFFNKVALLFAQIFQSLSFCHKLFLFLLHRFLPDVLLDNFNLVVHIFQLLDSLLRTYYFSPNIFQLLKSLPRLFPHLLQAFIDPDIGLYGQFVLYLILQSLLHSSHFLSYQLFLLIYIFMQPGCLFLSLLDGSIAKNLFLHLDIYCIGIFTMTLFACFLMLLEQNPNIILERLFDLLLEVVHFFLHSSLNKLLQRFLELLNSLMVNRLGQNFGFDVLVFGQGDLVFLLYLWVSWRLVALGFSQFSQFLVLSYLFLEHFWFLVLLRAP